MEITSILVLSIVVQQQVYHETNRGWIYSDKSTMQLMILVYVKMTDHSNVTNAESNNVDRLGWFPGRISICAQTARNTLSSSMMSYQRLIGPSTYQLSQLLHHQGVLYYAVFHLKFEIR